jgi:D-alanine--poly(phosphoribitol) ligase subunit 1
LFWIDSDARHADTGPFTVIDRILAQVQKTPDAPALTIGEHRIDYRTLLGRATAVAAALDDADPDRAEQLVILPAHRSLHTYVSVLGILLSGRAYLPLSPALPAQRASVMLDLAGARLLSGDPDRPWPEALADRQLTRIRPAQATLPAGQTSAIGTPETHLAYLLFTSGSTGTPKAVQVSHANLAAYVDAVTRRFNPGPGDRISQAFDLTFDLAGHDMFVAWTSGAELCVLDDKEMIAPGDFIRRHSLTFWFSTPSTASLMQRFRVLTPGSFPSLRWSLFCGEALPVATSRAWQAAAPGSTVENLYGPTEATIACTSYRVGNPDGLGDLAIVPIGRPLMGSRACLLPVDGWDDGGATIGELAIAGPQVALGYLKDPARTASQFVTLSDDAGVTHRAYRTGDVVRWDTHAGLHFLGRTDSQVKVRGHRVELGDIEAALRAASGSDLVAAVAWPVTDTGADGVVAFVAAATENEAGIRAGLAERLPRYMLPRRLHLVETLPRTISGKIDRVALRQQLAGESSA